MIRSVEGLENAEMMRTGYAIEYDVVVPHHWKNFETKIAQTYSPLDKWTERSGYEEESGARGLYAGINAVR